MDRGLTTDQVINNIAESKIFIFSGINQDLHTINSVQKNLKTRYPLSKFIIGGPITWSFHKAKSLHLLKEFDQIIIGDGEDIISEIIENILNNKHVGKIINNEKRFPLSKSKSLDIPLMSKYINHYYGAVVEVSRGCPFLCEFCDIRILPDNNKSHCKNPSLIGQDIENLIKLGKRQFILACDNFIGYGDHPRIPSMKTFWHENVRPDVPKEKIDSITSYEEDLKAGGGSSFMKWNKNGYSQNNGIFRKNGKLTSIPHCRECQVQPRCSKWNGKYPYEVQNNS